MSLKTPNERYQETNYWGFVGNPKMFLAKNDDGVAMRILDGVPYEPESLKLWESICEGFVIDIGAHTGIYTLHALKKARCFSVEPHYLNFARLVMNVKANSFSTEGLFFGCISDVDGVVDFSTNTALDYCSTGGCIGRGVRTVPVNAFRLDTLLAKGIHPKVKAIKIDTENHCRAVLSGSAEILTHRPKLLFECTEEGIGEVLDPLGYEYFLIDEENGLEPVKELVPEFKDGKPVMTRLNRYAVPREAR